jgi:4-carboxymuconolactone decarboxylase
MIARQQTVELPFYVHVALDSAVKPAELSEIITHLAFYAGWGNAMAAALATADVFELHSIGVDQLPGAAPHLMPLDQASEDQRAAAVQANVGPASQSLVDDTGSILFRDLWLRPDLAPRDRSLVTVSALIANGQVMQITYHLDRAMNNGLTEAEASEVLAQSAYYAGWPNAMSAVPVFKEIFAKRRG